MVLNINVDWISIPNIEIFSRKLTSLPAMKTMYFGGAVLPPTRINTMDKDWIFILAHESQTEMLHKLILVNVRN